MNLAKLDVLNDAGNKIPTPFVPQSIPPTSTALTLFVDGRGHTMQSGVTLKQCKEALIWSLGLQRYGNPLPVSALGLSLNATNELLVVDNASLASLGVKDGAKLDYFM